MIKTTIGEILKEEGRSRDWLHGKLKEQGVDIKKYRVAEICKNTRSSIKMNEFLAVARIFEIPRSKLHTLLVKNQGLYFDEKEQRIKGNI